MTPDFQHGDWITGSFWDGPARIVALQSREGYDQITVAVRDSTTHTYVLSPEDRAQLALFSPSEHRMLPFDGDPARFRLALHAHRLRLAQAIDPYAVLQPKALKRFMVKIADVARYGESTSISDS